MVSIPRDVAYSRFNHAPWESIKRENIMIWLAWSCFGVPFEDIKNDEAKMEFLSGSLEMLEARTGTTFVDGFEPNVEIMRLTLDPVIAKGRPLILYGLTNLVNWWLRDVVYSYHGMGLVSRPVVQADFSTKMGRSTISCGYPKAGHWKRLVLTQRRCPSSTCTD